MLDTEFFFPRPPEWQEQMIRALADKRVSLIMIAPDATVDGREDLKFPRTHPLVWEYVQQNFQVMPQGGLPAGVLLYRKR